MKLSAVLLLVGFLQVSAAVESQNKRVKINENNISLTELLWKIQSKTDFVFVFSSEDVDQFNDLSIELEGDLNEVLLQILDDKGLTFELRNNTYVIREKTAKEESSETKQVQDKVIIRGVVTDEQGLPIPGVNVIQEGTTNGTISEMSGEYTLSVSSKETSLVFSFIGFKTQTIALEGRTIVNVVMNVEVADLGEVVVTGVQTIEKGRATGSFTILKEDDLEQVVSTDFREKLIGAATGVYVDKNNNLLIRGESTLEATTSPLVVVDGIPLESSTLNINPNDIDQISVLKDAASASIWGVRAANGVIVITTKRGAKDGNVSVNYTGQFSVEDKVDVGDFHRLNASEYAALEFERYLGKGVLKWGPTQGYNPIEKVWLDYASKGTISLDEANAKVAAIGSFDNERQIEDLFYRRKMVQQHNLSLRAGSEKVSYYFSVNYDQTKAELVGNSMDKLNFIGNTDVNLTKGIDLQLGVRGSYLNSTANGDGGAWKRLPYERILDGNGDYVDQFNGLIDSYEALTEEYGFLDWSYNNLRDVRMNDKVNESTNFATSAKLILEPLKGLKFTTFGSYETGRSEGRDLYVEEHSYVKRMKNQYTEVDDMTTPDIVAYHLPRKGGILDLSYANSVSFDVRNTLEYDYTKNDIRVKLMAGNELYSFKTKFNSNRLFGYDDKLLTHEDIDLASLQKGHVRGFTGGYTSMDYTPLMSETVERYESYFGSAGLTYKDKYDLFGSARLDKTNLLVKARKYRNNPSWSIGGKWHLSQESFFHNAWINDLSLKASYGLGGNIHKGTAPNITGYVEQSTFLAGLNYLTIGNPENPQLGWEKTNVFNLGLDFSMFNSRLSGSLEYYNKNSKDLLSNVDSDPTTGWSSVYINAATVLNRGLDASLHGRILTKGFKWDAGVNFSYNYNEVTSISYTPSVGGLFSQTPLEGKPISYVAAIPYGGLDATGEPTVMKKGDDTKLNPYALAQFSIEDHKFMGRSTPPVFGSLSNTFRYKDFTLGILITYKLGHKVRMPSPDNSFFMDFNPTEWMSEKYRWTQPGDEATKWVPKLESTGLFVNSYRINAVKYSDFLVDDGDIVRLKSINLQYSLNKLFKSLPLKGGAIRFTAEDVWFWAANRYNLDSDYLAVSGFGSPLSLPVRAKYSVSLKLNL